MFTPKTDRIKYWADKNPKAIEELNRIFDKESSVYIDFGNVIHWQDKLGWHICLKRLKQFLDSFPNIIKINFYYGKIKNNPESIKMIKDIEYFKYNLITKDVKDIKKSIDITSIDKDSPTLLKNFIHKSLLGKLKIETIRQLNDELKDLNRQGILVLKDQKCNFDVELGIDMAMDDKENVIKNFILWSGDCDFVFPIQSLLKRDKKPVIFSISRNPSTELSETKAQIFDIRKIKEFICWKRELPK